jgi:hypothetical protein
MRLLKHLVHNLPDAGPLLHASQGLSRRQAPAGVCSTTTTVVLPAQTSIRTMTVTYVKPQEPPACTTTISVSLSSTLTTINSLTSTYTGPPSAQSSSPVCSIFFSLCSKLCSVDLWGDNVSHGVVNRTRTVQPDAIHCHKDKPSYSLAHNQCSNHGPAALFLDGCTNHLVAAVTRSIVSTNNTPVIVYILHYSFCKPVSAWIAKCNQKLWLLLCACKCIEWIQEGQTSEHRQTHFPLLPHRNHTNTKLRDHSFDSLLQLVHLSCIPPRKRLCTQTANPFRPLSSPHAAVLQQRQCNYGGFTKQPFPAIKTAA